MKVITETRARSNLAHAIAKRANRYTGSRRVIRYLAKGIVTECLQCRTERNQKYNDERREKYNTERLAKRAAKAIVEGKAIKRQETLAEYRRVNVKEYARDPVTRKVDVAKFLNILNRTE
jgi:hypothetical protein